jgi:hypothetical protein
VPALLPRTKSCNPPIAFALADRLVDLAIGFQVLVVEISGGISSQERLVSGPPITSIAAQRAIYQTADKGNAITRAAVAVVTVARVIDRSIAPVIATSVSAVMTATSVSGVSAHCVSAHCVSAHCVSAHCVSGAVTACGVAGGERISCERHTTERHHGSESNDCFMKHETLLFRLKQRFM